MRKVCVVIGVVCLLQNMIYADVVITHFSTNWWEALADNIQTVPERTDIDVGREIDIVSGDTDFDLDGDGKVEFTLVREGGNIREYELGHYEVDYSDGFSLRLGEGVSVTALSSPTETGTLLDQNTLWLGDEEANGYGHLFQLYPMSCDTQTGVCVVGEIDSSGPFLGGGYFGLSFTNQITDTLHFGWVQMADNSSNGHSYGHVLTYAYESESGMGIVVPEPGSVCMILGGTAGLMLYRRELQRSRKHPDDYCYR
jgi:hypothetical protein